MGRLPSGRSVAVLFLARQCESSRIGSLQRWGQRLLGRERQQATVRAAHASAVHRQLETLATEIASRGLADDAQIRHRFAALTTRRVVRDPAGFRALSQGLRLEVRRTARHEVLPPGQTAEAAPARLPSGDAPAPRRAPGPGPARAMPATEALSPARALELEEALVAGMGQSIDRALAAAIEANDWAPLDRLSFHAITPQSVARATPGREAIASLGQRAGAQWRAAIAAGDPGARGLARDRMEKLAAMLQPDDRGHAQDCLIAHWQASAMA